MKKHLLICSLVALVGATQVSAQSAELRLEVNSGGRDPLSERTNELYRSFTGRLNQLSAKYRNQVGRKKTAPYVIPAVVRLTQNGAPLPTGGRTRSNELTLDIDSTFNTPADNTRVAFMQSVYNNAKATIESIYGDAAISGTVRVVNFDAQIGDRNAITGGFYLPNNGTGGREIRLPLNASREFAAISLLHCILLAYLPDSLFSYDVYQEGLVRATVARLARIPAVLPGLDQGVIEQILENSYEIGAYYDWTNQRSLVGSRFIAPNLINAPIADGTLGGIFLPKYKMATSLWQKVAAEYPTFTKDFLAAYRTQTALSNNPAGLKTLALTTLAAISPSPTIEGIPASDWFDQQYIFDTRNIPGTKLHTLVAPITDGLAGTDFGVFTFEATWFSSDINGNETLLSGTSYPIFWDRDFNRIVPSAQTERIDIAGSYGSVAPNFTDENAGLPYRVTVDIPVQDRVVRRYVPAGAIATPTSTTPNNFFGTVVGFTPPANGSLRVRLTVGSTTFPDVLVQNQAFGTLINATSFTGSAATTVTLLSRDASGNETTLLTRKVNKGPGGLALELGSNQVVPNLLQNLLFGGIQLMGLPGEPLRSSLDDVFGGTNFLAARYNPGLVRYDLFPALGSAGGGFGYFVRVPANQTPVIPGRIESNIAVAVALRPGWNLITNPLLEVVPFTRVDVVRAADFPRTYAGASGQDASDTGIPILGRNVFQFVPGANDATTGVPEGGTLIAATSFAPGTGYFVRCLVPEGAVLLFRPTQSRGRSRDATLLQNPEFAVRVDVSGNRESSPTFFGMSRTALDGFDSRWDSNLPPSIGGLQASIAVGNEQRYFDVKSLSETKSFRLVVNGLKAKGNYVLSFRSLAGRYRTIRVRNLTTGRVNTVNPLNNTFGFVAGSATTFFDITVEGARR